ncbi:MAG: hypothetical protein R2939_19945 [Kofleriaceae bacterium]
MLKLLLGILKGAVLGGAIGLGAYQLGLDGGMHWVTYGVVGAVVGLLVGKPLWRLLADKHATSATGILKAIVGFGVGVGIYALVAKAWGGFRLTLSDETRWIHDWQPILGAAIGALWGGFVELDDAIDDPKGKPARPAGKA